jgi:lipid A ethanolaminephosphotransferase
MTKTIRSQYVVLCFSILLVAIYNQSLWSGIFQAQTDVSFHKLLFLGSCAFFLTALINFLINVVAIKHVIKPVLIIIVISSSIASYFMDSYGVKINADMLQNVFETDISEATELLNLSFMGHFILWGLLPSLVIARLKIKQSAFIRQLTINIFSMLMSILVMGLVAAFFYQDYASTFRNHRELRYLINPTNYIYAVSKNIRQQFENKDKPVKSISDNVKVGAIAAAKQRRTIAVVVLGETARAQQLHLNGYTRQTTPNLERSDIINFSHVTSCGTATAASVPCMFSKFSRDDYSNDKGHQYESVLDVVSDSGTKVIWRDNNSGCKGVCDRIEQQNLAHLTIPEFCNDKECFDEVLLQGIDAVIDKVQGDVLLVLHQKGSHGPAYYQRVPKMFEQFTPICTTSELQDCTQQQITNAYDNTILYTDYVLAKIIDYLKSRSNAEDTAMIYVSDHGESLGEKNMYLHGAPYFMAPDEQTHVPMVLWMSDNYAVDYHVSRSCMEQKADNEFSHDNLFHSVLGMLDISVDSYQKSLDIFDSCTVKQNLG